MSQDEKYLHVGRMVWERTEARKSLAALHHQINAIGRRFSELYPPLLRSQLAPGELLPALSTLESMTRSREFDKSVEILSEYLALMQRVEDLTAGLREIGIE